MEGRQLKSLAFKSFYCLKTLHLRPYTLYLVYKLYGQKCARSSKRAGPVIVDP
jgi:hypothetical protein